MLLDGIKRAFRADKKVVETGFTAASEMHKAMANWKPLLLSPDKMAQEKGPMEARILDAARNNPAIAGAIRSQVDGIVGSKFRLAMRPDGKKMGLSSEQMKDWADQVEYEFTCYAESPECWFDARRERTFTDMIRMVASQDLYHGEFFASKEWRTSPLGYKTCFQIIDPTRIDGCPEGANDNGQWALGIRRDSFGAPVAYAVKQREILNDFNARTTRSVPRRNRFGWLQMLHAYDPMRPDQARGVSRIASALTTIKQADRWHETELEQAILGASYAMFIRSNMPDIDRVFGSGGLTNEYGQLIAARNAHYEEKIATAAGAKIGHLMPGDEIETVNIGHPNKAFDSFDASTMRKVARAMGMSYEEFSGDISKVSYASARVALLMTERLYGSKRESMPKRVANLMLRIWLDEAVDKGRVTPPVDYWQNRDSLSRAEWINGRSGHVDELKTARARKVNLETGVQTQQEIAMEDGFDWEDRFQQRQVEALAKIKALEAADITVPNSLKAKILLGELNGSGVQPSELELDALQES